MIDTTYRFNSRIGEVANRFIQQNPGQLKKPLNSLTNGDKKAVTLLDESKRDAFLDKLSGYAKPEERILILARYHHMRHASLEKAADAFLDKLSGYAKPEERILILARYHHMRHASLEKAATRWPKLQIDFMTIHASKGQQADYVIIVGLQEGSDCFPAAALACRRGVMVFRLRRGSRLWKRRYCHRLRISRTLKNGG